MVEPSTTSSPGTTHQSLRQPNFYRNGVHEYGGMRFLIQGRRIVNALDLEIEHELKPFRGSPPHNFKIPTDDPLPDFVDHPLFRVMAPSLDGGVYFARGVPNQVILEWLKMYGVSNPHLHWCWGTTRLTLTTDEVFMTNLLPIIFVGMDTRHYAYVPRIVDQVREVGRRVLFTTPNPTLLGLLWAKEIRADLGMPPTGVDLTDVASSLTTRILRNQEPAWSV